MLIASVACGALYWGHATTSLIVPTEVAGREGVGRRVARRRATGAGGPPGLGAASPGPGGQRARGGAPGPLDPASDSEDRASRPRPGAAEVLAPTEKQRIVAMACSAPPPGAARWTVRLIAQEAVKRRLVPR